MIDDARFEALRARLGELHGRSHALARQLGDVDLGELRSPADLALIPVLRKSALARCSAPSRRSAASPPRRLAPSRAFLLRPAASTSPNPPARDPWGAAKAFAAAGVDARRDRGQLLLLSPDAGRPDPRERRPRARLPGHSGRPGKTEQLIAAIAHFEPERLFRAARFPEDRARQGARGRRRRLVDQEGARLRRRAAAEPCARSSKAPESGRGRPMPPPSSASSPRRPTTPTAGCCRACWSTTTSSSRS